MKKVIISMDPGKENYSVAIQVIEDQEPKVEFVKLLEYRIRDLKEKAEPPFQNQLELFTKEIEDILDKFNPVECSMERYQVRFRTMGCTTEVVNVMIGVVSSICQKRNIPVRLIIAGEWKNHFNRVCPLSLNDIYKLVKKLPPHVIDSGLIGLYCSMKNNDWYTEENLFKYCKILKEFYDGSKSQKL